MKYYIAAIFSNIALLLYSLPWTYGANHTTLGFYLIAFFWFIFAWIILLVQIIFCIKLKIAKDINWKHHLLASCLIVISYVGLLIGILNDYMVTV